ncbi:MAG: hypothetical protein HKN94_17340 [Acidimicrobiales bacterium]|nr:hypothetical protein [Acidimicrobiales bacterium]
MTVTITIAFEAGEGCRDELVDAMIGVIPDTQAFEGCENIRFVESVDQPGSLLLVEDWASIEHYQRYKAWRAESGTSVLSKGLVKGTPETQVFNPLL